ncbi:uncharacterized protein L969DRAFT_25138 [Mixia osmundae IAM 14324]|uniref:Uncharacterized protein n=1 Tax=Mixia osmundae (strain CBS 9802 / IAM 14324 / JCM 22182 / KY 12970) TaxID=764103 RepID=G7DSP3_MIXOS|nr:uncharacterized protein L969DRAFT_25138 [Mixia osmundae IAM 14324]KEI37900.1 hypothetical protein L969DRAFT_25138 [Mixia osmundae IAM 14324]GAA93603.1 hypothetical protein E5Q_00247 [Mixia osmundae IAM 14324]
MKHSAALLLAVVGLVRGQTTASIFLPGFDPQPLSASIVGSDASTTTYVIAANGDGIGVLTVTEGPSTLAYTTTAGDGSFTFTENCAIGQAIATCTDVAAGTSANFPGTSIYNVQVATAMLPVTIIGTGGAAQGSSTTSQATSSSTSSSGGASEMTSSPATTGMSTTAAMSQPSATPSAVMQASSADHLAVMASCFLAGCLSLLGGAVLLA